MVLQTDTKITYIWDLHQDASCCPFGHLAEGRHPRFWEKIVVTYDVLIPSKLYVQGKYVEILERPKIGREQNGTILSYRYCKMEGVWTKTLQQWSLQFVT